MTSERQWFAAKSLYRSRLQGAPQPMDEATREAAELLHPGGMSRPSEPPGGRYASLVEERVVLIAAADADEALEKAEAEAAAYASQLSLNDYAQPIEKKVLAYLEVYSMSGTPLDGSELFSRTFLVASKHSDEELTKRLCPDDEVDSSVREYFMPNFHLTAARTALPE